MNLVEMSLKDFADMTASDAPAPGGGAVAALEGAVGAALTSMVSALTIGKKKYADVQDLALKTQETAQSLKNELLKMIDEDAAAFNEVSAVFAMPKETDEQKAERKAAMQKALKGCTEPPLRMMELAVETLLLVNSVMGKLNAGAVSDLGCAAAALRAAAQSSWLNVLINVGMINDEEFSSLARQKGQDLLKQTVELSDSIYAQVEAELQ